MRFLSFFSGIEAASAAWLPLGWECVGVAEIEPAPSAVLKHRYPDVPNLGDITKITDAQILALGHIDLIVGGFPCQDLSVAGKRKGLRNADGSVTRSGLFFDAMRLVRLAQEHCGLRYVLIENVPGLMSSNKGADFASVVGEITGSDFGPPCDGWENTGAALGPSGLIEWATLDAQWFGLAQRRKRVFALGDFGDWASRSPILFEPASLRGHPAPRRKEGKDVAPTISSRTTGGGGLGTDFDLDGGLISRCLTAHPARIDAESETFVVTHSLRGEGHDASEDGTGRGTPLVAVSVALRGRDGGAACEVGDDKAFTLRASGGGGDKPHVLAYAIQERAVSENVEAGPQGKGYQPDTAYTLEARHHVQAVAFDLAQITSKTNRTKPEDGLPASTLSAASNMHVAGTLTSNGDAHSGFKDANGLVAARSAVRRLTPRECERLQGFRDDYTLVPNRGKPMADGPRYKCLGNSMAVPVMAWMGRRIAAEDAR